MTSSPILVASGAMMQFLPWLLFGLLAGSVADHHDRRRLVMLADGLRAVIVRRWWSSSSPGTATVLDRPGHRVPVRHRRGLRRHSRQHAAADARASGGPGHRQRPACRPGIWSANQLAGPPLGAFLFAIGSFWPFLVQILCVTLAVILISRIARTPVPQREAAAAGRQAASDPRGSAVAARQPSGAHARADHLRLQRDVGGAVGRPRPLRHRVPAHGRRRLRRAHDGVRAGRTRSRSSASAGSSATSRSRPSCACACRSRW